MELSKRLAAAFIAICMLLMSFTAFAATISVPSEDMILPTDGSSVSLTITSTGNANNCVGLVVKKDDEAKIGIDASKITSRITLAGTSYDGLLIDGTFTINTTNYNVDNAAESSKVLANGELTHFQFANVEVTAFRKSSSGALVLEAEPQKFMDAIVPGTTKKVNPEALKREPDENGVIALTNDDFVALTAEQESALKGNPSRGEAGQYDFTASGLAGYKITLSAKAGDKYGTNFDTGVFPAGTVFVAASKLNLNGATAKTEWGYTVANKTEAPEGTYVAQESGEYAVYALKTGYNSDSTRNSRARINGVDFTFTQANMPAELSAKSGYYWQKDENGKTVTLKEGELIVVNLRSNQTYSRTAALAIVPVSGAAAIDADPPMWASTASYNPDKLVSQAELEWLHDQTAIEFVAPPAITRTINVNGTDYEVSSDDAEAVLSVSAADFDNIPISGVTVMDALVKAGVINDSNKTDYLKKVSVKLNGMQVYNLDKYVISTGDVVTTSAIETIDVTNVEPTSLGIGPLYSTLGATGNYIKLCPSKDNIVKSNISFAYDGTTFIKDALKNAKVVGYMEVAKAITKNYTAGELAGTQVVIPVGSRVYYIDEYFTGQVITTDTHGLTMAGSITIANEGSKPLHINLPDGTIGHHPYHIQNNNYSWDKVYVMNNQTTNTVKARFIESTGAWQLATDGGNYIYVIKYTVDENGKFVSAVSEQADYILFNDPLCVELKDNERAVVWGYAPYAGAGTGGTTMVPLTGVLANPAK